MKYLHCLFLFHLTCIAASHEVDVAPIQWNGVAGYLAVDQADVQEKLAAYQGSRLFLPDTTVFPGLITSDQHVVYFNFGYLTVDDFHGVEPSPQVTVNIPLLSDHPSGPPSNYSLAVAKFYSSDRGDIPAVNVAYPYYPVDEIRITDDEAVIRHGQEELRVSFVKSKPCKPPKDVVVHEFTEFVLDDVQTGAPLPDFSYCQRHPEETAEFCQVGKQLEDDLQSWKYQICQAWESHDHTSCETSLQIENITPYFRDILAVADNQPTVVASESYHGHYTVKMIYPC